MNSCLLHLVQNKQCQPLDLKRFLNWYFFKLVHSFGFIKTEWNKWKDEMERPFDDQIKIYINEALIEACKLDKYEMVFEFLNKGFKIYDKEFKGCELENGKNEHRQKMIENQFNQRHLKIFRAKSTPSYQLANFCYRYKKYKNENNGEPPSLLSDVSGEDVFSETLHNVKIAMNLSVDEYDLAEYAKQLNFIVNDGRHFLADLVSQCDNLGEAKLLLSHDSKLNHYKLKYENTDWEYQRLDEACLSNHKSLVTHDFSQRIFRETWHKSENLKKPVALANIAQIEGVGKIIKSMLLAPVYALFYLLAYMPYKEFGSLGTLQGRLECSPVLQDLVFHHSVPRNRCYSDIASHLALIMFLLLTMINPYDEPEVLDIDWYDICLVLWAFGTWVKCLTEAVYFFKCFFSYGLKSKRTHWRRSFQSISRDTYSVLQFLCCTLILVGTLFKFIGFLNCNNEPGDNPMWNQTDSILHIYICKQDDPLLHCDDSYLKTGYSLIGIGATLCILNLLHWFELCSKLGPIILSLRQTIGDILKILTTFLVFLIAFSVGLHFSLRLSNMYCEDERQKEVARKTVKDRTCTGNRTQVDTYLTGFNLEDNVNHFRSFQESMKTCFWSLFDPGHLEVIGCTQGPPRHLGMLLWASYQIGNVVIIMNLLIALMNATIYTFTIEKEKITHWRFARTQIWRQYFDRSRTCCLPVPFNLLEILVYPVIRIIKRLARMGGSGNTEVQSEERGIVGSGSEKEYLDLVYRLCARYILRKKRMEKK
eukprot:GFUD01031602.1.p1 GENE.GFUD01031602.1~~GFUD01031602.1.p1  ORF type:complete len:762 (-),score=111.18 GFUD01031602.1:98-2383(-)